MTKYKSVDVTRMWAVHAWVVFTDTTLHKARHRAAYHTTRQVIITTLPLSQQ